MISEDARERMRRAYYLEKKTLRQIAREEGFSRVTIQKAISYRMVPGASAANL